MNLAPREIDKLMIYVVADLARKRGTAVLKLNYSEAVALISEAILEAARDGRTSPSAWSSASRSSSPTTSWTGVREMLPPSRSRPAFMDGTKLVSCHDPIGA